MKIALALTALGGLALAGCNAPSGGNFVSVAATDLANIVSHSGQACSDLQTLLSAAAIPMSQIAAANPNDPNIQKAATSVNGVFALGNASCQQLAGSFSATPAAKTTLYIPLSAYRKLH